MRISQKYISLLILQVVMLGAFAGTLKFNPKINTSNSTEKSTKASNLNVLAIMVEFEEDTLDYTTGNGTFNSGYPDSLLLDAVDHNAEYFTDQLTYVENYFNSVSNGNVQFDNITVLDTVLTLTHPIWYYNQNHTDELLEEKLYELYQSSWNKLAGDNSIPFSSYDTFVIFHAGSGQEFSVGYDDTPFDIPSVFFSENDLAATSVTAWDGTEINNCIILPECEWQVSNDEWYYAGMGGISTLMFAHRLGIPNLYSSEDGQSCIGRFGLMDQGSANFSGMIPSSVCAWVKELQGWTEIKDVTTSQNDLMVKSDSTIYRIPVNADEYLLIENRTPNNYLLADSTIFGYDRDGLRMSFTVGRYGIESYEIVDPGFKTLVAIQDNDYDFPLTYGFDVDEDSGSYGDPLPARTGGVLVWHIDKRKTTEYNIVNNTVNDDHDNRGVYLEEGDGSFDIGEDYWLFNAGNGTQLGWYFDFFFGNNEMWLLYSNEDLSSVEFSSDSYPRSDTNEGTDTGIRLFNFSNISQTMTFSYELENQLTGYPLNSGLENSNYMPVYSGDELYHFFYRADGEARLLYQDSLIYNDNIGFNISTNIYPVQYKDNIVIVHGDSLGMSAININTRTLNTVPSVKITAQIKPGVIPTMTGLSVWSDLFVSDIVSGMKDLIDFAVIYDLNNDPDFIASIVEDSLLVLNESGIVISQYSDNVNTDSKIYLAGLQYNIENILVINNNSVENFDLYLNKQSIEINNIALLDDLDEDGNVDYLVTNQGNIEVYNEHGYMEDGFPLDTKADKIIETFIFEANDGSLTPDWYKGKFCTFVDSAMNCGLYSFDGDYVRTENFTLGSDIRDLGLLVSTEQVCIYSYSDLGTLNVFPLHTGTIDSYRLKQNGFILLSPEAASTTSSITNKKSVYNWPNPAKGNSTNFRFFLNEASRVNITVYDLNGNNVETLSQNFTASGDNFEIVWDVSSRSTGIYTAVLEFAAGGKKEKYKVKVAVIK